MNVSYAGFNDEYIYDAQSSVFMLTNGNYYFHDKRSSYGGLFVNGFKIMQTLPVDAEMVILGQHQAALSFGDENVRIAISKNSIIINSSVELPLVLDVRRPFDRTDNDRHYSVEHLLDRDLITYEKTGKYKKLICVHGLLEDGRGWIPVSYAHDKERGDISEAYVYHIGTLRKGRTVITTGDKVKEVLMENASVKEPVSSEGSDLVRGLCSSSLSGLYNGRHYYAGFPWFSQNWSRDELISLKGVHIAKLPLKERLLYWADNIGQDGLLMNNNAHSTLRSTDSIGWLALRIKENLKMFNDTEKKKILSALKKSIAALEQNYTKNGFAYSPAHSSWMDTSPSGHEREGALIEIQALRLCMYELLYKLSKDKYYLNKERDLAAAVKKSFFNGYLYDQINDKTKRPNAFIACYVYPKLLSKKEWKVCFDNLLDGLWLDWGGLATIDKKSKQFKQVHTGMNNLSYHQGDSWMWVNNIAACTMFMIDGKYFRSYIDAIYHAGINELLLHGSLGNCAEISDAAELHSRGCLNQLWSSATLLELHEKTRTLRSSGRR